MLSTFTHTTLFMQSATEYEVNDEPVVTSFLVWTESNHFNIIVVS